MFILIFFQYFFTNGIAMPRAKNKDLADDTIEKSREEKKTPT